MHLKEVELVGAEALNLAGNHVYVPGESAAMQALERVIADIAPTNIPVLLMGESGTGKEVVAMRIHRLSRRAQGPFIRLSCAAVTADSLSAARSDENGNGADRPGSLLLDEVSELEPSCQPRLLHVFPDDTGDPDAGARLISTTRRNLEEEMHAGRFREELYYRINGACLRLPPLRHRREDIPSLADYFLDKYAALFGRQRPALGAPGLRTLQEHSWPGNVRELENVMRKMVALGNEGLALADLGNGHSEHAPGNGNGGGISLKEAARTASRQAERELILKVLARTRWNRKRAAQELQISYKALLYKLKQIGLEDSVVC